MDASTPLDCRFDHDEYYVADWCSENSSMAGYEPGPVDVLALGTFLAGLNLLSLPICFLGVALIIAVRPLPSLSNLLYS